MVGLVCVHLYQALKCFTLEVEVVRRMALTLMLLLLVIWAVLEAVEAVVL
jgi:hypothetical protein